MLGLTGSIGMGKSTVAAMFRNQGVPVFDADAAVRRLQGTDGAAVAAIAAAFPGTVRDGQLDRVELGRRVFSDAAALEHLEAIIHPLVAAERARFLRRHRARLLVALDIPLLLEVGSYEFVDQVVVVSAPARVQRARVLTRPNMTIARLDAVLARQMPDAKKRSLADEVIETGRGKRHTRMRVQIICARNNSFTVVRFHHAGRFKHRIRASISRHRR